MDDIADGIVTAMSHPAGENEDFNVSAREELTVAEIARIIWEACGEPPTSSSWSTSELRGGRAAALAVGGEGARLLGWEAQIDVRDGIAQTVEWLREQDSPQSTVHGPQS